MKALSRALLLAAVLLFCALFAQRAHSFWIFTLDDAYITARFAHELAHTGAITWQGDRIEGYSNFLLLLLEALGYEPSVSASFNGLGMAAEALRG